MTIETNKTTYMTNMNTYLPDVNITSSLDENTKLPDTLVNLIQHSMELLELKTKINDIDNNLQDNENKA